MDNYSIKKILVPIDFSDNAFTAIDFAGRVAKLTGAEIMIAHVVEIMPITGGPFIFANPDVLSYEGKIIDISNNHLKDVAANYEAKYAVTINHITLTGRTHAEIKDFSEKIKADLIVMGTHGTSGFREFVVGSNTFRVVSDSLCPVLSVQHNAANTDFKNILVPFRDKPHSREKVDYAIAFAKIFGATINVLGIDTEQSEDHLKRIQLEGDQIISIIEHSGLTGKLKVQSADYHPDLVLNYAKEINADLIVAMADLEKDSLLEYLSGSFVKQLVNHSTIPVLSIHPKFNTDTVDLRFY